MNTQCAPRLARQHGQAMLLTVLLLAVGVSAVVYNFATPGKQSIARDRITAAALAQAKDALIGYAASNANQPGILPCPDSDNDGSADAPCSALGVTAIGRLPWRTLGLPDLRDGAGECLWYAVSGNFKNSGVSGSASVNSDSAGTLQVYDSSGNVTVTAPDAALAIVFAPGEVLPGQNRAPTGSTVCGGNVTASNYLDALTVGGNSYDNATGAAGTNRFVDSSRAAVASQLNDKLLPITSDSVFNVVNVRVAKEALNAAEAYRTANSYYPFANPYGTTTSPYDCSSGLLRGRFPTRTTGSCGQAAWPASSLPTWFEPNNWTLVTHYAISKTCSQMGLPLGLDALIAPVLCGLAANLPVLATPPISTILALLGISFTDDPVQVTGVTGTNGARAVVIVSGRATTAQVHTCASVGQCLEDASNTDGDATYVKPSRYPASNDRMAVVCDTSSSCPVVP